MAKLLCFMWGHKWYIRYVPGSDQRLYITFCKCCGVTKENDK